MKAKKIIPWIPSILIVIAAVIICIIYTVVYGAPNGAMAYFQLFGCMLVPILFPMYGLIFKRPFPTAISAIVAVHVLFANFLGTILDWYSLIWWWDLFMHGAFGLVGGILAYTFLMRWDGGKMNKVLFFTFIFCFIMACAVLWEIFEFVTDGIFPQNDAQDSKDFVGRDAVRDTMEDLIITLVGIAVFYLAVLVDKLAKLGLCNKFLCNEVGRKSAKEEEAASSPTKGE